MAVLLGKRLGPMKYSPLSARRGEVYRPDTRLIASCDQKFCQRISQIVPIAGTIRTRSSHNRQPESSAHLHALRHRQQDGIDYLVMEISKANARAAVAEGPLR